jgi:hypothetical protein
MLLAGSAPADEPRAIWACYDVAVLGTLRVTEEGYQVSVTKVYAGGRLPNRIDLNLADGDGPGLSLSYHRNAVFYLSRNDARGFDLVGTAGREQLDGRGLLTRARVDQLADARDLTRCSAIG